MSEASNLKFRTESIVIVLQLFSVQALRASWCSRLLVSAARPSPSMVGWSGTVARKLSKAALNCSTEVPFMSLIEVGKRLNNLQPFTARDDSLALLTTAGAGLKSCLGVTIIHFLAKWVKDSRSYPNI